MFYRSFCGNRVEKISSQGVVKTVTTGSDEDGNSFVDNDGMTVTSTTDDFGRVSSVTTNCDNEPKFSTLYEYADGSAANSTTKQISKLSQYVGDVNDPDNKFLEYNYEYYDNGNLYKISDGTNFIRYNYDEMNQLIVRFDKINEYITNYYYDDAGNITRVLKRNLDSNGVPSTTISDDTYTYEENGWNDRLLSYNNESITYDSMGNPLNYRGGMSFEWMSGRMLETVHKNSNTITMVYDSDGMRTHKNTVTYEYDSEKKLISLTKGSNTLLFYYDADGNPIAVKKGSNIYYYIRNLQGDIVKIVNKLDRAIVNYEYDEWGRILSITNRQGTPITSDTHIGLLNPFRYRGYVYDDETGLYYLQSRYYDPVTGRFIDADVFCDTQSGSPLSTNMYCYCENDALLRIDTTGKWYYNLKDYYNDKVLPLKNMCSNKYSSGVFPNKSIDNITQSLYNKAYQKYIEFVDRHNYNNSVLNYCNVRSFGYIYNQSSMYPGALLVGSTDRRVYENGCLPIAIHNLVCRVGRPPNFANLVLELDLNGGFDNLVSGTHTDIVKPYLNAHSIKFTHYNSVEKYIKNACRFSSSIIIVDNVDTLGRPSGGTHAYCIFRSFDKKT